MDGEPVIPAPLEGDDDDVAWALQTAAVQWQRGARADAVVWLRRAVESAISAGNPERTRDLTRLAASVADRLVSEALAAPDSMAPPSGGSRLGSDVDDLLTAESVSPPPRQRGSSHSLTGEIPIDFEDEEGGDDFDDQAPTIPPPRDEGGDESVSPAARHAEDDYDDDTADIGDEELDVSADELFSARPAHPSEHVSADELFSSRPSPASEPSIGTGDVFSARFPAALDAGDEPFGVRISTLAEGDPTAGLSDLDDGSFAPPRREAEPPVPAIAVAAPIPVAPVAPPPEQPSEPPPVEAEPPSLLVGGVSIDQVRGLEDLPEASQYRLAASAVLTSLSADEEVGSFGAALVTRGRVGIMPAIADVAASVASAGDIVFTQGTLDDSVSVRVVALEDDTVVASWSADELAASMSDCPWVSDDLKLVGDRFQALAGATLGPLGDRLDDSLRGMVLSRLDVKAFNPGETIVTAGKVVPGLHVVGAGSVEFVDGDAVKDEASPGDILFAAEVLGAGKAKMTARAGKNGALVLVASRSVAHELLMSVPPLVEILAG